MDRFEEIRAREQMFFENIRLHAKIDELKAEIERLTKERVTVRCGECRYYAEDYDVGHICLNFEKHVRSDGYCYQGERRPRE